MARLEVKLYPKAQEDLEGIWLYTYQKWGPVQAKNYTGILRDQWGKLAKNPSLGRKCNYIRKGYRRLEVGKHIIFYKPDKKFIVIVRILHESMDVQEHL